MDFYRDISYYYDYIFPFKKGTHEFLLDSLNLVKLLPNQKGKILDIACGSGSYALALSTLADEVIGTDLDQLMIQQANHKKNNNRVEFKVHNMLEVSELKVDNGGYDLIYCIGNSIVHLDNIIEIYSVINQVYHLLNHGGVFVIQVINFDRILKNHIKSLPTIVNEDEGIRFIRDYNHNLHKHKIEFSTTLDIDTERITEQYSQKVLLYPLRVDEVYQGFENAGFRNIELFGGFNKEVYHKDTSYPLIIRGHK